MLERVGRVTVAGGAVTRWPSRRAPERRSAPGSGRGCAAGSGRCSRAPTARGAAVESRPGARRGPVAAAAAGPAPTEWRYTIYAGPVERPRSRARIRRSGALLLSGPLVLAARRSRSASSSCSARLTALLGHPGLAIIALAVSVKMLLLPLAAVARAAAGAGQRHAGAASARARRHQRGPPGEERARRTLALYREPGVHPLYTLKSLAGFLIQIPVFIAVFDMLAEDFDLYRVSFLWIQDLSRPDALAAAARCVPFFGCDLNLLPFLMSGVSLATTAALPLAGPHAGARRAGSAATSSGMTGLFFLLFYTFPAGMVLYWTSTNAFQLVSQELGRWRRGRRGAG